MEDLPYKADYDRMGLSTCSVCKRVLGSGTLRLAALLQSDKNDKKFPKWYHFDCFFKKQRPKAMGDIDRVWDLKWEDQVKINRKINPNRDEVHAPDNELYWLHCDTFDACKMELESNLKDKEPEEILKANNQNIQGKEKTLTLLADIMRFGALQPCPECGGQLMFDNKGYKCTGNASEWSNCVYVTMKPVRQETKIPTDLAERYPFLKAYKGNVEKRFIPNYPRSVDSLRMKGLAISRLAHKPVQTVTTDTAVDPNSKLQAEAHVYQDNGGKFTVVLSKTDIQKGRNSYHKFQVLVANNGQKFWMYRAWGRIGTAIGDNRVDDYPTLADAKKAFEVLYYEKTKNKWENRASYVKAPNAYYPLDIDYAEEVKKNLSDEATGGPSGPATSLPMKLDERVQDLIKLIFDIKAMKRVMVEFEMDMDKMPLGKLSQTRIRSAYGVLAELSDLIEGRGSNSKLIGASNRFYTLIPHSFGLSLPPALKTLPAVRKKMNMLETLLEIEVAYSMLTTNNTSVNMKTNPIAHHYDLLKTDIVPLERTAPEYQYLCQYVRNTHAETHNTYELEIEAIFKVNRNGEANRYEPFKKLHNRRLLWHGSRLTNYAGILSNGLRIAPPEAPSTGYMFGKGIYFADMVSKSANYCHTSSANPTGLVLLCEVALGEMKECLSSENIIVLPYGKHSTIGIGRTVPDPNQVFTRPDGVVVPYGRPVTRSDRPYGSAYNSLQYNEFIVYNPAQVKVQYLFKLNFKHRY